MKDLIIPVNNEAHSRALEALFGPEKSQEFLKAYQAIDSAMVFGYERGLKDAVDTYTIEPAAQLNATAEGAEGIFKAQVVPQNAVEALEKEAFSNGYDIGKHEGRMEGFKAGYMDAEAAYRSEDLVQAAQNMEDSYNDGYVDGVSDARMMPAEADRVVAELCVEDEEVDAYDDQADEDGFDGTYDNYDIFTYDDEYTYVDDVDSGDEQPIAADTF